MSDQLVKPRESLRQSDAATIREPGLPTLVYGWIWLKYDMYEAIGIWLLDLWTDFLLNTPRRRNMLTPATGLSILNRTLPGS